jgi:hypothetical protein
MTAGLPGAGIGGLFYIGSTLVLPIRVLMRRLRGLPSGVEHRHVWHSVGLASGIVAAIAATGWVLGLVVPAEMLHVGATTAAGVTSRRTAIPVATFGAAVATLAFVLLSVEAARVVVTRQDARRRRQEELAL